MPRPQPKDLICERGGLGPDLDRDATVQARERRERQLAYAEQARAYAANRPTAVRPAEDTPKARRLELLERQKEYSARLPKPRPRPEPKRVSAPGAAATPADEGQRELERILDRLQAHDELRRRLDQILPDLEE